MTDSNSELVTYRLQKARETLIDARILADASRWNPCVNRLYYACFYAVSALLIKEGLSSTKHTGLRSLFNRHFVKTNKVPKDKARIFNDLLSDVRKAIMWILSVLKNLRFYRGSLKPKRLFKILPLL
jgi:uncharacterized protein (UPF0332 family)